MLKREIPASSAAMNTSVAQTAAIRFPMVIKFPRFDESLTVEHYLAIGLKPGRDTSRAMCYRHFWPEL
jgi:hypothetical protein